MPITGKEMVRLLERNGWTCVRTNGSHYLMEKDGKLIPVPYHNTDLKKGTEMSIRKRAGIKK